jgi:hypothetical protein
MHETFYLGIISTRRLTDLTENNKWTSPKKIAGWIYTGPASAVLGRPRSSAMAHRAVTQSG